jgi:hemolysin III
LGLFALLAASPFLIRSAMTRGSTAFTVGVCVYAASAVVLYLASALYHGTPHPRAKRVLKTLDHSAIYLLIAGSYTPFTLGVLRGPWGWSLFGIVWGLALAGIVFKFVAGTGFPLLSNAVYLVMGWLVVIAIRPLYLALPAAGLGWLVAGGLAYTAGVYFYAAERLRYAHFVWHLFVLAGTAFHFIAVYGYAA